MGCSVVPPAIRYSLSKAGGAAVASQHRLPSARQNVLRRSDYTGNFSYFKLIALPGASLHRTQRKVNWGPVSEHKLQHEQFP